MLSNAWLQGEALISHVYNVTLKSVNDLINGVNYFDGVDAQEVINSGDEDSAKNLCGMLSDKYGVPAYV